MMSKIQKIYKITLNIFFSVVAVFVVVGAIALILGVRPIIFTTNSMSPDIPTGSLALVKPVDPQNINIEDIITTPRARDGVNITHRVVSIEETSDNTWKMKMQGDANSTPDIETYNVTDGANRVFWSIKNLGNVVLFFQKNWILSVTILLALLILMFMPPKQEKVSKNKHSEKYQNDTNNIN